MCGQVWEHVTRNLAQKIAGKNRGEYLKGRHWVRFARECGLGARQVLARVRTLTQSVIAEAQAAADDVVRMPAGDHPILAQARQAVEDRARTLLLQLDELAEESPEQPVSSRGESVLPND
jgi:serine/threonine-protein kinase HipA